MTWMGIRGGESVLAVDLPGTVEGHNAIIARSESRSAGALDSVNHVLDIDTTTLDLKTRTASSTSAPPTRTAAYGNLMAQTNRDSPNVHVVDPADGTVLDTFIGTGVRNGHWLAITPFQG